MAKSKSKNKKGTVNKKAETASVLPKDTKKAEGKPQSSDKGKGKQAKPENQSKAEDPKPGNESGSGNGGNGNGDDTNSTPLDPVNFSVIESLYAHGFLEKKQLEGLGEEGLRRALGGSFAAGYVGSFFKNCGGSESGRIAQAITPINNRELLDCREPRSVGSISDYAYLQNLWKELSGIHDEVVKRQGNPGPAEPPDLSTLEASRANAEICLPAIDLANEVLEAQVGAPDHVSDLLPYQTSAKEKNDKEDKKEKENNSREVPEHSSPFPSYAGIGAYLKLQRSSAAFQLPYDQPTDVLRTFLGNEAVSRLETMRTWRESVHAFAQDPENPATPTRGRNPKPGYSHDLRRHPLSLELSLELLGVSSSEWVILLDQNLQTAWPVPKTPQKKSKTEKTKKPTVSLGNFLSWADLSYEEAAQLGRFRTAGKKLPSCRPCTLVEVIQGDDEDSRFIRLYHVFRRNFQNLAAPSEFLLWAQEPPDVSQEESPETSEANTSKSPKPPEPPKVLSSQIILRNLAALKLLINELGGTVEEWNDYFKEPTKKVEWLTKKINKCAVHAQHAVGAQKGFPATCLRSEELERLSALIGLEEEVRELDTESKNKKPITEESDKHYYSDPLRLLRLVEVAIKIIETGWTIGELDFLVSNHKIIHSIDGIKGPFSLDTTRDDSQRPPSFDVP